MKRRISSCTLTLYFYFVVLVKGQRKANPHQTIKVHTTSPLPATYIHPSDLPENFSWANVNGTSYLTRNLNQHLPQYCGSCWAHAALSSLADRIKISRSMVGDVGPDINLSIQYLLNCGSEVAGSCKGGSASGAYQFIKQNGFIPYDSCQPYLACSKDSIQGFCQFIDTSCNPMNTCRTCTSPSKGGTCHSISTFPNATVSEYGVYHKDVSSIMMEIYARGPVTTGAAGSYLNNYQGGIISDISLKDIPPTHEVSIIGWGTEQKSRKKYWIIRNSWGEYWGEMSFARIRLGLNILGIEEEITWVTPGIYTSHNFPCYEDGTNCEIKDNVSLYGLYKDPSLDKIAWGRHLGERPSFPPTYN